MRSDTRVSVVIELTENNDSVHATHVSALVCTALGVDDTL